MIARRPIYLATTAWAVFGLVTAPLPGYAQDAAEQPAAYGDSAGGDPPARVGRLAEVEGTVSTHAAAETNWSPAVLNAPVSAGDAFWTEPGATAKLEVTGSAVWLGASTELDLTTLDDTALHASEPQGELYVHLRALQPNETYTLETPRGTVTMAANGRYEIVAGDTENPTTVSVLDGAAQITGANLSLQVGANQSASITGDGSQQGQAGLQGQVGALTQDTFLSDMVRREQPVQAQGSVAPPPVVAQMTGGEDLNRYGAWEDNADYGNVWYPQVSTGWAPYREGRWSYVAPWGWTWVDAAPWGFAPFHYGRWVQIGPRWGWAPVYGGYQPQYRPVYAPALVTFFGLGVGVGVGIGLGGHFGGNVGWVPLGPREAYYPPYRVSRTYVNRVNITNIRNTTNIYEGRTQRAALPINQYANYRGATVVPARTMTDSRPVAGAFRQPSATELGGARGLVGRPAIAPGAQTLGLTPRAAQRMNIAAPAPRRAPGPQVAAPGVAQARPGLPPLRPARPGAARPSGSPAMRPGGAPGPAIAHPAEPGLGQASTGRPALRTPGERPRVPGADRPAANAVPGDRAPGAAIGAEGRVRPPGQPALRTPGPHPAVGGPAASNVPVPPAAAPTPQLHQRPAAAPGTARGNAPGRVTPPAAPAERGAPPAPRVQTPTHPQPRPTLEHAPVPALAPVRPHNQPRPQSQPRPPVQAPAPRPPQPHPEPQGHPEPHPQAQPHPQHRRNDTPPH